MNEAQHQSAHSLTRSEKALYTLGLVLVFVLQIFALHRQSLTNDGSYHLLAGYQALHSGENLLNLEHPPLVKLLAAWPTLLDPRADLEVVGVGEWREGIVALHADPAWLQRNVRRGRWVLLFLVGLPLLGVIYLLGRELFSPRVGLLAVLLTGLNFSVIPHLTLFQTDATVTLGFLWVHLEGLRYGGRPNIGAALGLGLALGLTLAAKFSAVLLGPAVGLIFLLALRGANSGLKILGHLLATGLVALVALLGIYTIANWHYLEEDGRALIRDYCQNRSTLVVEDRLEPHEARLLAVEAWSPPLAQYLTGLLGIRAQNAIGIYPSFALGEVSSHGRWWYFPLLFVVKIPLVILVLMGSWIFFRARAPQEGEGSFRGLRDRRLWPPYLTVGLYGAMAIVSNYNLGFRHLLPILPFLFLGLARLWAHRPRIVTVAILLLSLESILLTPLWMSATNTWWLGEFNPSRLAFGASNLEYGQNFITLNRELEKRGIERLHLLYPGLIEASI